MHDRIEETFLQDFRLILRRMLADHYQITEWNLSSKEPQRFDLHIYDKQIMT